MLTFYLQLIETEEDRQLFTSVYETYRRQMLFVANDILHSSHLSEDAVHDAFIGVANNMDRLHGRTGADIKNYVLKAAKNAAINLLKKETKQQDYYAETEEAPEDNTVLDAICDKMGQAQIVSAILQMNDPYQTVLYCNLVLELDCKAIASTLQRKQSAVRQQLSRGKRMLAQSLEEVLAEHE